MGSPAGKLGRHEVRRAITSGDCADMASFIMRLSSVDRAARVAAGAGPTDRPARGAGRHLQGVHGSGASVQIRLRLPRTMRGREVNEMGAPPAGVRIPVNRPCVPRNSISSPRYSPMLNSFPWGWVTLFGNFGALVQGRLDGPQLGPNWARIGPEMGPSGARIGHMPWNWRQVGGVVMHRRRPGMGPGRGSQGHAPGGGVGRRASSGASSSGAVSPIAPHVAIPSPGDVVAWSAAVRVDVPEYAGEQLREAAHRMRCTMVSLILRLMSAHRDQDGQPLFYIRPCDLVSDRRKTRS